MRQALQQICAGGKAGLRLLACREFHLFKEHNLKLFRRTDVELLAGKRIDVFGENDDFGTHSSCEFGDVGNVQHDSRAFYLREHGHERHVHRLENASHLLSL